MSVVLLWLGCLFCPLGVAGLAEAWDLLRPRRRHPAQALEDWTAGYLAALDDLSAPSQPDDHPL